MLIIDIDNLFRKFAKENISKISQSVNNDNIDEKKEALYTLFQNTTFSELGGKTPLNFYESSSEDLVEVLKEHIDKNVPVSEYLIHALIHSGNEDEIVELLNETSDEDLLLILIEVLSERNIKKCDNRLIALLFSEKTSNKVKDACVEYLLDKDVFDLITEAALTTFNISGAACELLANQNKRSDVITDVLKREFLKHLDKAPEYCSYLVRYGDESFLDCLYEALNAATDYVCFKEIGLAIEALGGVFDAKKDFSKDKNYIKIKEASKSEHKNNG